MDANDDGSLVLSTIENAKLTPLTCSICAKQFSNEKRYFGHLRVHSSSVPRSSKQCSHSEPSFDSKARLKIHDHLRHSLDRPYKCSKCDNIFERASQLDYHDRSIHQHEKSQICQICGKGFFRKNDLRTHLNVHLGTNQSICEICGRKFNHVSNLIRHCRTHIGSKPYPCTICGKRFTQISSLARHKRIHDRVFNEMLDSKKRAETMVVRISENPEDLTELPQKKITKRRHYCRTCGESFQYMVLLRQHKRIHIRVTEKTQASNETLPAKDLIRSSTNVSQVVHTEKVTILENNGATNSPEQEIPNNSIRDHLMELARKMNSIDMESERDVSISISDILSPYNCNEIEVSNGDTLEPKLESHNEVLEKEYDIVQCLNGVDFSTVDSKLPDVSSIRSNTEDNSNHQKSQSRESKTEKSKQLLLGQDKCLQVKSRELYSDICESEYLKNSQVQSLELQEIENVSSFQENTNKKNLSLETFDKSTTDANPSDFIQRFPNIENYRELHASGQNDATQMPRVRLVQNEDGEQFFELIREPLEYERNRTTENTREKNPENSPIIITDNARISGKTKQQISASSNPGIRRDKKEISSESGRNASKDRTRKFKCNECDKWFSTAYNFKQHAGTHFSDQQRFRCTDCGLTFAWKSTLNKHLAGNHRPDGPLKFVCEICPKVYSTLSQVNEHVKRDHLKERNHVCPLCDKSFFKKFDLKTHSRTHTDERPYVCRACGKGFHHQSHIIRHERIHSGERPYECNICQRAFTQPGSLKTHRQRHRDVKIDILEYRMDEDDPMTLAVQ